MNFQRKHSVLTSDIHYTASDGLTLSVLVNLKDTRFILLPLFAASLAAVSQVMGAPDGKQAASLPASRISQITRNPTHCRLQLLMFEHSRQSD